MTPTLRQLRAFSHAYRLGSLTRAARAMHLTQSAVSVLLQQLEEALGVRLFERTSRALRPTQAGHETYDMAQPLLSGIDQLVSHARGLAERRRGHLRFAVATSVAAALMPAVLERFVRRYPDIRLEIVDTGPDGLIQPVLDGEVEFSIGTPEAATPAAELRPLLRDHLAAICLRDSPLAARGRVSWRDLDGLPVITVRSGNAIRTLIDQAMAQAGTVFAPTWEVSYLSTALAMTARGLGVSVLPGYLVAGFQYPDLVTRRLHAPTVARSLYLVTRPRHVLSPAAQALVEAFGELLPRPG